MSIIRKILCILPLLMIYMSLNAEIQPEWIKGTGFASLQDSYLIVRSANAQTPEVADELAVEKVKKDAQFRSFTIVDTYTEKTDSGYIVYVLAQICRIEGYNVSERLVKTNRYNLIGESFVPGMAQIKKGQAVKGAAFIATEAICIGGIIFSECQRNSYISKIKDTRDPVLMKKYKNNSNNWATARNIFIAGASAIYIWNVIDGIVAKGKTQIVGPNGKKIAFAPYYSPSSFMSSESFGLAMNITW